MEKKTITDHVALSGTLATTAWISKKFYAHLRITYVVSPKNRAVSPPMARVTISYPAGFNHIWFRGCGWVGVPLG